MERREFLKGASLGAVGAVVAYTWHGTTTGYAGSGQAKHHIRSFGPTPGRID